MPGSSEVTKCGGCKKNIRGESIQCDVCGLWFETKCSGADASAISFLLSSAGKSSTIHWFCTSCDSSTKRIFQQLASMENRFTVLEDQVGEVRRLVVDEVIESVNALTAKVEGIIDLNETKSSEKSTIVRENSTKMVNEVSAEMRDREKRKDNVVVSGKNVTEEKIKKLLDEAELIPKNITPINTKEKRMFIVTLDSEQNKWKLVGKAKSIILSNTDLQDIFVNPDLSKLERKEQFLLRQELRQRRSAGEDVFIKKGVIVARKPTK